MQDMLTLKFTALSDPTRRAILAKLADKEMTVQELSKPFSISAPAITKHLKVLENAGLILRGREAQYRPCRIQAQGLKEVSDWISEYRVFWEASFDRLDDYLQTMTQKKKTTKKGTKNAGKK